MNRKGTHVLLIVALLLAGPTFGQVSPEEHAKHHPEGEPAVAQDAAPGTGEGMGGMMEGMGGMMDKMGVPPPKELYPALMELEDLPLEERASVQAQAHDRMKNGSSRLSAGLTRLAEAAPSDDFAEMQVALGAMREGLAEFDSGLAAHRALAEGTSPKSVALQWFKREMNLLDVGVQPGTDGPFGLSWFHFFSMLLLTVFAAAMIGMYFLKMRRATAVLQHIVAESSAESSPGSDSSPALSPLAHVASTSAGRPVVRTVKGPWTGQLQVARVFPETPEIQTFRLMLPDGAPLPFRFLPGQFLTLTAEVDGKSVKRSYTIASSPTVADYAEITVKREASGLVSKHLHEEIHEGDLLEVRAPAGKFIFTGEEAESVVLIGGGVGITPLMSVVRYLTDRAWPGEITLIYSGRASSEFVFREELESRQRRHPNLKVIATMSRESDSAWTGARGRLTKELLVGEVPDIASRRVHVCGPAAFMEAVLIMLRDLGVPDGYVETESFGPARKPTAAPQEDPAQSVGQSASAPIESAVVEFKRSGKSAPLPEGMTILDVADEIGIDIENSCRVGSCGSCKVKLLDGHVEMEVEDGLDAGEKEAGIILACQATSAGNVCVDV